MKRGFVYHISYVPNAVYNDEKIIYRECFKIQAIYFKTQGTYFKICALYFRSVQMSEN